MPPPLPLHLLFLTRSSCMICTNAKKTLAAVWQRRPYEYTEVDVMTPAGAEYRAYEFDVPVIKVSKVIGGEHGKPKLGEMVWERMHKIDEEEVTSVLEELGGRWKGEFELLPGDKEGEGKREGEGKKE